MKKGILAAMLLGMTLLTPVVASNAAVINGPNAQNDITSERIAVMDDLVLSVLKQSASRVGAAVMEKYVTPKLIKMINGPDANNGASSNNSTYDSSNYAYDVNNNSNSGTTNYTYDTNGSSNDSSNNSTSNYNYDVSGDHQP